MLLFFKHTSSINLSETRFQYEQVMYLTSTRALRHIQSTRGIDAGDQRGASTQGISAGNYVISPLTYALRLCTHLSDVTGTEQTCDVI